MPKDLKPLFIDIIQFKYQDKNSLPELAILIGTLRDQLQVTAKNKVLKKVLQFALDSGQWYLNDAFAADGEPDHFKREFKIGKARATEVINVLGYRADAKRKRKKK